MFNFIKNISPLELVIIGLIVVALFGTTIAKVLGRKGGEAFKEVKKIKKSFTEALDNDDTTSQKTIKTQNQ